MTENFFQNCLIIMVKTPVAGRVKTRLARDIGSGRATFLYRHMVRNLILRVGTDSRWKTCLAVSPDHDIAHPFWKSLSLPLISFMPQGQGDLGQRLQRVVNCAGAGHVIVIGADIPEITSDHIAKAFRILRSHDAVLGPSEDGGYWLVGQKKYMKNRDVFENVRWSSEYTFSDTMRNLQGSSVAFADVLQDLDTIQEYENLKEICGRLFVMRKKCAQAGSLERILI